MLARRSSVFLSYQGVDITADLVPDLLTFSYTDNASGTADDVAISIADPGRKWIDKWIFEKGDSFEASILTENWRRDKEKAKLPCGTFIVDEPEYKGRPSVISLKGVSIPANSNFMHVKRNKVWKSIGLKSIAKDIASRYGLQLFYDSPTNPTYKTREQTDSSDSSFLQELCEEEGFAFKLTDEKVIIFSECVYEKKNEIAEFNEWDDAVLDYSFKTQLAHTAYAGVSLKYLDPKTGKTIDYLFSVKEIDVKTDKVYQLNQRAKTLDEAVRLARSKLRALNKKETIASLSVTGDVRLLSSATIRLKGFGSFDGKYFIDKAAHSVGSGYSTSLELHKVLEGY